MTRSIVILPQAGWDREGNDFAFGDLQIDVRRRLDLDVAFQRSASIKAIGPRDVAGRTPIGLSLDIGVHGLLHAHPFDRSEESARSCPVAA